MSRVTLFALVMIAATGGATYALRHYRPVPERSASFSTIPMEQNGYFGDERRFDSTSYEILKADTTTLRYYRGPNGTSVWLFVAYFSSQQYGSQIHSPRHCLPGGGWRIENGVQPFSVTLGDNSFDVNRLDIAFREQRQLMLYWFETRSGHVRNEFGLKFDLMQNALRFRPTDAAIVRITVPFLAGESDSAATTRAMHFLEEFYPSIESSLPFRQ